MKNSAKGRKHTEDTKKSMSSLSKNRKGENNSFYGKVHTVKSRLLMKEIALNRTSPNNPGIEVEITDLENKTTTVYNSIRKAALAINSDIKTILLLRRRREKVQLVKGFNSPYRKKYMITINRN